MYICISFISFSAKSQLNFSNYVLIKDIDIVSNRLSNFVTGNRIEKIDSLSKDAFNNDNLSEILENISTISIKSYGVSGIASASIRGTNSNQIAVLWNGFNIQDPLTAGLSLNMIPNSFVDNISIQYGGSSSLFGSAAIGAVIHLNNNAEFDKGFKTELNTSYGNFNSKNIGLNLSFSKKKFNSKFKAIYKSSENNFPFKNISKFGQPVDINKNSAIESRGFLQENFVRFSDYSSLSTHYWYQETFRQVAKNMTSDAGNAYQEDNWHKAAIKYYKNINKLNFYFRNGFFYTNVHYVDNDVYINATHSSFQAITDLETKLNINNNNFFNIGLNNHYTQGISESFTDTQELNKIAFYFSYKFISENNRIVLISSIREEFYSNEFIESNFSFGGNFILTKKLESKFNISKSFRAPTFNDLYWADGFARGNPDLKPENAYTSELGFVYSPFNNKKTLNIELTAFANYINDLILWQQIENIWTPINLKENLSRGIELNIKGLINTNKLKFDYKLSYTFTKSTVEKIAENESENLLHNQLPYVPLHNANAKISATYKKLSVSYFQNLVGQRYTDATNLKQLDSYLLGNIALNYKINIKKNQINTFIKINNVWNTNYQSVYLYPNPLRNYEVGIKLVIVNK